MTPTIYTAAIAAAAIALSFTHPANAQIERQHYQCYDIIYHDSKDVPRDVQLTDQFGESAGLVGHPVRLCNPVDKNGEGIANEEVHLVCYAIRTDPDVKVSTVLVQNQFTDEDKLFIGERDTLCVPSRKRINE